MLGTEEYLYKLSLMIEDFLDQTILGTGQNDTVHGVEWDSIQSQRDVLSVSFARHPLVSQNLLGIEERQDDLEGDAIVQLVLGDLEHEALARQRLQHLDLAYLEADHPIHRQKL